MDVWPNIASPLTFQQVVAMDPMVLAYVGDGVQSLYVRTHLAAEHGGRAGQLHQLSIAKVSAVAQAAEVDVVRSRFSEAEDKIYRLARNHKSKSMAKNAPATDYRKASGLEAVWGYLYLTGQNERLGQLLSIAHKFEE